MRQRFYINDSAIATAKVRRLEVVTEIIRNSHPESSICISCLDAHFDNIKLEMSEGLTIWQRGYLQANIYPHTPHPPIIVELDTDKQIIQIVECPEYFYQYVRQQNSLPSYATWVNQGGIPERYWKIQRQFSAMNPHVI